MSLGIVMLLIVILGYASNWLNWRFLNYRATHLLYYIGAFIHEGSHALLCLATGAKIQEFKVLSTQPHVTHGGSKLPFIGGALISAAPIFGGLLFLLFVDHSLLADHFIIPAFDGSWKDTLWAPLSFLGQFRPWEWQSLVMALLLLNSGAMLGPSLQDIKNMWLVLIILFFIKIPFLAEIGLAAAALIAANICVQAILIVLLKLVAMIRKKPTPLDSQS